MRVFVASLATETNTFAPLYVDRSAFERDFYCPPGTHPATPTLCSGPMVAGREIAAREGLTLIEGTATWAEPAGPVSQAGYESLREEILDQIRAALPLDIVMYGLHGAMVTVNYDDVEGDLLARTREIVGKDCIIGAEFDMHCHLSPLRVESADLITIFKEFPHTDFLDRARDLAELCLRAARKEIQPVAHVFDPRGSCGFMTSREPGRSFVDKIMAMEGKNGILSISIAHGFQAGDVPEMGSKFLVYSDGPNEAAAALPKELARERMSWGPAARPPSYGPDAAIAKALECPSQPVILADRWDSPGGGVAGDSSEMILKLMEYPDIPAAIGILWDPQAVEFCRAAGAGATINLRFCGKAVPTSGPPVDAEVHIRAVTEDLQYPFEESIVTVGPAAAITIGNLDIVLASGRAQTFSPPAFTKLGIDLSQKKVVVVKSSNHFYAAFSKIAAEILYLDSGGAYPWDVHKNDYKKLRRPFYPLDPMTWL